MTLIAFRDPVSAWTHCAWLVLALPATWILWRRCRGDRPRQYSMLIFGLGLVACYAGSTLFHGVWAPTPRLELYDRIDHVGIYLLIAGSYTPLAWSMMRDRWRFGVLFSVWGAALLGSSLLIFGGMMSTATSTLIYMTMGWGAIFCYLELLRSVSHRTLFPLLLGGIFYSVGAVLNLSKWPVIVPGVVGPHEVFHLFVMAGSLAHFLFIFSTVAIYPRPASNLREISLRRSSTGRPQFGRGWVKSVDVS